MGSGHLGSFLAIEQRIWIAPGIGEEQVAVKCRGFAGMRWIEPKLS
jgi:hypothetical protein